jgi:hypothetical protein
MFRHVMMFTWSDDVDDADIAAISSALDRLPDAIPEIVAYHHGADARVNDGNYDYVVVGDFGSVEDYVTYRDAPAHTDLIRDLVAGRVKTRAAVQYAVEG